MLLYLKAVCWHENLDYWYRGNNVSHVVIVRPLKAGYFNFSSAELIYLPSESATEPQVRSSLLYVIHVAWLM